MKVLSVTSEVFPFVKTGGLADVTGALPKSLQKYGIRTITLVPGDLLFNGAHEAALIGVPGRVCSGNDFERHGCVFRKLESRADLVKALWLTPRFVSRQFRDLGVSELRAVVERLSKGLTLDGFAHALGTDAG